MKPFKLLLLIAVICLAPAVFAKDFSVQTKTSEHQKQVRDLNQKLQASSLPGQELLYLWDSFDSTWSFTNKILYTYNADGLVTEQLRQDSNSNNLSRTQITYDSEGRETNYMTQNYVGGQWENSMKYLTEYDAYGHVTKMIGYSWESNAWDTVYGEIRTLTLNGGNYVTEVEAKQWDYSTGDWMNSYKLIYTLDGNGVPTEMIYQEWGGIMWDNVDRSTNATFKSWDPEMLNGEALYYLVQTWDGSMWDDVNRETSTYDSYGGGVSVREDYSNNAWVNSMRRTIIHDNKSNFIEYKQEEWNNNAWELFDRFTEDLTYDGSDNIIERITSYRNFLSGQMQLDSRHIYSNFVAGIAGNKTDGLTLYPNPVKDQLFITIPEKAEQLFIYDITGQEVYAGEADERMINLSGIAPGMYILKIRGHKGSFHAKFVKE